MRKLLPGSFYNPITGLGLIAAGLCLALITLLVVIDLTAAQPHPYLGLVTFIVLPGFMLAALALAGFGVFRNGRRMRRGGEPGSMLPWVDFAKPTHRNAFLIVLSGGGLLAMASAFGSYKAYEYTESVEFCGRVCHKVMKPEYVAYKSSPHARVPCVSCHIGSGATWFVKSKLSGSYQVYSALFNKYHRPIETPIGNLRPARETCEQCHWPKHFFGAKLQSRTYFLSDDGNTAARYGMLLRIGGGNPAHGATDGIHKHMYLQSSVSYVATDRQRNVIPYVEARGADGKVTVYRSTDVAITDDQIRNAPRHEVDCIECHNRPTHGYSHPAAAVNVAMSEGQISSTLPGIKKLAVETLEKPYKTEGEAVAKIAEEIRAYYKTQHPKIADERRGDVEAAIRQTQAIYRRNYFPEMKVSWRGFPNHLGHMYSAGCFRCHDGKHVSEDGRVISRECGVCHQMISQPGADGKQVESLKGMEFRHPVDIGDAWKTTNCSECHAAKAE